MSYMTMGDEIHALRCDRSSILAELAEVKLQRDRLRASLRWVVTRAEQNERGEPIPEDFEDWFHGARSILNSMEVE